MIHFWTIKRFHSRAIGALGAALAIMLLLDTTTSWADTPNPHLKLNESWITISGTVESVEPNSFVLDFGDGTVLVEMDDGDRDADGYMLSGGDRVTVSGHIDADFFEKTKIGAGSVYVENLGTTFFASSLDDEDWGVAESSIIPPITHSKMVVSGTVAKVNSNDFLIDTGDRMLRVDVSELPFNPLDDEGYLKIDEGDRVKVLGQIDVNLFEGRQLVADTVIEMRRG